MLIRILVFVTCATGVPASHASAQIYTWRDGSGTLVLSDRPRYPDPEPESRHGPFELLVREYAREHGIRAALVRAVIQVESAFDPLAISPRGAMGLMQLMPATARALGVVNPYNPAENIRAGTEYLRTLIDRYAGNEELALAAYNAGFGVVDRHGGRVPPHPETREYVRRVTRAATESLVSAQR